MDVSRACNRQGGAGDPRAPRTARRLPRERLPRAEPWSGGSPDPIPNSAVKPHLAESTAAPGRGRTGRSARRGRFSASHGRPDGTAGPADAAAPTGARPRPLFGARRGAEAAWPRGGAIPGACRTLADFLGRTCATKLYYYLDAHAGVFLFLCALNREMGTASFFENIRTRIMFSGKLASMTEPKGSSGKGGFP